MTSLSLKKWALELVKPENEQPDTWLLRWLRLFFMAMFGIYVKFLGLFHGIKNGKITYPQKLFHESFLQIGRWIQRSKIPKIQKIKKNHGTSLTHTGNALNFPKKKFLGGPCSWCCNASNVHPGRYDRNLRSRNGKRQ